MAEPVKPCAHLEGRMQAIEDEMAVFREWKETMEKQTAATKELIEVLQDFAGAVRVLQRLGRLLRALAVIGGGFGATWYFFKDMIGHAIQYMGRMM